MAETLKQVLLDPDRRPAVVNDLHRLVDAEVSGQSGMSGMAVKGGYALLSKINSTFVSDAINSMLDDLVAQAEPFYADYHAAGTASGQSLAQYLESRSGELADALLTVTDRRAEGSRRDSVKKVYGKLRPQGHKHVQDAVPRLAAVIETHVAAVAEQG